MLDKLLTEEQLTYFDVQEIPLIGNKVMYRILAVEDYNRNQLPLYDYDQQRYWK